MSRLLENRLKRLEDRRRSNGDEIFLVWCRPHQDETKELRKAADAASVVIPADGAMWPESSSRVVCAHWPSDGDREMPAPRWTTIEKMEMDELSLLIKRVRDRWLTIGLITEAEWDEIDPPRSMPIYIGSPQHKALQEARRRWLES